VPLIRDAVSERVGFIFYAATMAISGFIIAFTTSWKVALVVLGATPVLVLTMGFVSYSLSYYADKGQRMYPQAGGIAQEVQSFDFRAAFPCPPLFNSLLLYRA